jgi:hypothetical protein
MFDRLLKGIKGNPITLKESTTKWHWEVGLTPFQQGMVEGLFLLFSLVGICSFACFVYLRFI